MSTNTCSSTSTTDLYQRHIICSDSYSQTMTNEHNDDDYANYEETFLQKPSILIHKNNIKKSDQTVLCRINRYSIGCWTKPAYLLTN
ncbi:unnamed protein product [Rotaria sordida]|uniref:Uncharacterized protein n=1 Tax=Rotaria sordida TaxID=392033 RepID=A0A814CSB0_9BILA|nr:unnamed protein product [Rotaria sordida]CAF0989767.1 unnamed protein product [Rotaria sordida]CAF1093990.1 unnamed protein product [Rotaria sordida]CAF1123455.1 unnamed protein product [Rotaria sordida]CAF1343059.1 unnamed protein product [Rotaria sordida]